MTKPKIALNDVYKSFGARPVLNGLTLNVMPGENVVIIGGSGSGKSVMIKCILGLIRPDKGTILIDGEDVTHMRPHQRAMVTRKTGVLFQGGALFDSMPVWQNIAFGLIHGRATARSKAREIALTCLADVGLPSEVGDFFPAELSGGMQKRVALARAIAAAPEIIFFDEPTTGLDPIMADIINNLIRKCVQDLGATAVTITHDMKSARKIATRIAMLYEGKIIWQGQAEDVDHSANPMVDQFIHGRAEGPIRMQLRRS